MTTRIVSTMATVALLAMPGMVTAETAGQAEYMTSCAVCHGLTGKGDGHFTDLMKTAVPDLTTVSQRNEGVFPVLDILHIIDGRSGMRGHGGEMPIWGDRFAADAISDLTGDYSATYVVRGRILSLAYYLESIQK